LGDSASELADQPVSLGVDDPAHDPRTDRSRAASRYDKYAITYLATIVLDHRIRI
jgi:hypothetical protein